MASGLTPLEAAVLVLIARGVDNPRDIAELLNVSEGDVRRVIEGLVARGFLERRERRILFFKREKLVLTELGFEALSDAEKILREIAERVRRATQAIMEAKRGQHNAEEQPVVLAPDEVILAPLLVTLGLLPGLLALDMLALLGAGVDASTHHGHGGH